MAQVQPPLPVSRLLDGISSKLDSLALDQDRFSLDIQDELNKLKQTICASRTVIVDAEGQSLRRNDLRNWLAVLKQVLSNADQLVDELSASGPAGSSGKSACCLCQTSGNGVVPRDAVERIKEIGEGLHYIADEGKSRLVERPLERFAVVRDRETTSSEGLGVIVGRKREKQMLIELVLSHRADKLFAIALVGEGCIGKTTIARAVFNDEDVDASFDLMLWVGVPEDFQMTMVVQKILEAATGKKYGDISIHQLEQLLHKNIDGKKFLLVLDGIRHLSPDGWNRFKGFLAGGASRSRIIVTTRSREVGYYTSSGEVFEVSALSEDDSLSLLLSLAFSSSSAGSAAHQDLGREIVKMCHRNPLAIRMMGCLLYFRSNLSEWPSLVNDEEWTKQGNSMLTVLRLSYKYLPPNLKRCFAYCALFPKGYVISVSDLISQWISHGYVRTRSRYQSVEDVGLDYFRDLLWRSFFEEVGVDELGNVVTCKMHDPVHEFARVVAEKQIVITHHGTYSFIERMTRHLSSCIDPHSRWNVPWPSLEAAADHLQTFLLLKEPHNILGDFETGPIIREKECDKLFSSIKKLRVLDLHSSAILAVPRSLGKLEHLQYLDLSENEWIEKLPESTAELQRLQILKLDNCKRLKQLPRDTKKLANLSHLGVDNCVDLTHMPRGIGQLTSLSRLSRFVVAKDSLLSKPSGSLSELHGLNNLRGTLEIHKLQHGRHALSQIRAANLREKHHLQTLTLAWDERGDEDASDAAEDEVALEELEPSMNLRGLEVIEFIGLKFPGWLSSLMNLVQIRVVSCKNCKHLPPLGQLQFLERLTIDSLPALLYVDNNNAESAFTPTFFRSLKRLAILNCPNLEGWWKPTTSNVSEGNPRRFPILFDLSIKSCPKLSSVPLFPPLKYLTISGADKTLLQQIKSAMAVSPETSTAASASTSDVHPFPPQKSELRSLEIGGIENLEYFLRDKNLSLLKHLHISNCRELMTLPRAIGLLFYLENLSISRCRRLALSEDEGWYDVERKGLRLLRFLHISNLAKLVALPVWLKNSPKLLQLEISRCRNLASLPDWMTELLTLQYLTINSCPLLCEKCGSNKGSEWPKIAQIPYIKVAHKVIQTAGIYKLRKPSVLPRCPRLFFPNQ